MEGKIQNPVLPISCNSGLSSYRFSVLRPTLDLEFFWASVYPVLYRPFEVFTRWCLPVSPKGSFVMSSLPVSQAISCHPVITEAWVQSQAIPCWICDGHSDTHIGHYNSTNGLYLFVRPLIHLFSPPFICLFILLSLVVCCRGDR
jgi:hypothetical protein